MNPSTATNTASSRADATAEDEPHVSVLCASYRRVREVRFARNFLSRRCIAGTDPARMIVAGIGAVGVYSYPGPGPSALENASSVAPA